ncbi:hypothetical protein ACRAWD_31250 [Caulobacter segnis]
MAGIDVYKNPSADIIEGGVGGTVNLRTTPAVRQQQAHHRLFARRFVRRPGQEVEAFRLDSLQRSLQYGDRRDRLPDRPGPTQAQEPHRHRVSVDPYYVRTDLVPGKTVYVPGGFGYRSLDFDRERKGIDAAVQWRPNDQWEATLQFLRSSAMMASSEHAVGFNVGSSNGPAAGTSFTYDDTGHFIQGTLARTPGGTSLGSSTIDTRYAERSSVTSDYSLNLKYNPNDKWSFSGDVQYIYAKTKTVDTTAFNALSADASPANLDPTGKLPTITMNNDKAFTSNPASYYLRGRDGPTRPQRGQRAGHAVGRRLRVRRRRLAEVVQVRRAQHRSPDHDPRDHLSAGIR